MTQISDYLAEKEEQRIGIDEASIDSVMLERMTACDGLSDITSRLESMGFYIDSIMWLLDDYIEGLGADVPPMVKHIQWDMTHLSHDCKRLTADAYDAARVARGMMEYPRTALGYPVEREARERMALRP